MGPFKNALAGLRAAFLTASVAVSTFLGPVAGSIFGFLTPAELSRAFVAGLAGSGLVGFATGFLTTIGLDAKASPSGIGPALVGFLAVFLADQLRRLGHNAPLPGATVLYQGEPVIVPGDLTTEATDRYLDIPDDFRFRPIKLNDASDEFGPSPVRLIEYDFEYKARPEVDAEHPQGPEVRPSPFDLKTVEANRPGCCGNAVDGVCKDPVKLSPGGYGFLPRSEESRA